MSQTAQTIISQIGNKAMFMMGTKHIGTTANAIQIHIGSGAKCNGKVVNLIIVELDPTDTYTVKFCKVGKLGCNTINEVDMVYADSLRNVIEANTGFYLSL